LTITDAGVPGEHGWEPPPYVLMDQVCFTTPRSDPWQERLPLRDVPAIVLSEALRDVDLFVSVASIGAGEPAPETEDEQQRWRTERERYEQQMAARATTRIALLRELIPVLGLGDRVRVEGHYALVHGTRSHYRVHLGCGNIYLDPSGRYLCIVPRRRELDRICLPFEDEDLKTAEILSKVLLLADDARIDDPTILAQIPHTR
jgi:hypothetical protein